MLVLTRAMALSVVMLSAASYGQESQTTLAAKAKAAEKIVEFQECCSKIKDQKLLGDIVLTGDDWGKRRTALDYITDQDVLEMLSKKCKDPDIRYYAEKRLDTVREGSSLDAVEKVIWLNTKSGTTVRVQKAPATTWKEGTSVIAVEKK